MSTSLNPPSSVSHSYSSSASMAMWLPRLTFLGGEEGLVSCWDRGRWEGLASGWGRGRWDGPASSWGRDQVGTTTCIVSPAVATVVGGSTEAFDSTCEWLLRSLSSCSRSFTQLCSLMSTASAFWEDFFTSQRASFISLICPCRSLICPCTHSSASILMLLMNVGQVLCTAFSMSGHSRLICPRLWAPSRWLMYLWQQAHPLAWWMVILSGHPLIFQAAPWHAAIKVLVSKDTVTEVCPDTGVGTAEPVSIRTCGGFWDWSIFYDRRWRWWQLLRNT